MCRETAEVVVDVLVRHTREKEIRGERDRGKNKVRGKNKLKEVKR